MRRSELESFVLGLVWQLGPCSPYAVRRMLADSPSAQWSGSAGAIYPLMRRLESAGLIASKSARNGKRKRREYAITTKGQASLRTWIGPPFAPEVVTVTADPLRSRARFLAALKPAERRAWVDAALASLAEVESRVRRWHDRYGRDAAPALGMLTRHGELEIEFRRAWLEELRRST
ncbi:MAG: PadR family transcriptional regulator [Phycisphaerales bacterium]